jgi:hypothetical protein
VTAHRLLAESKVATDAETKPGQRFEVLLAQRDRGRKAVTRGAPGPRSPPVVRPWHI